MTGDEVGAEMTDTVKTHINHLLSELGRFAKLLSQITLLLCKVIIIDNIAPSQSYYRILLLRSVRSLNPMRPHQYFSLRFVVAESSETQITPTVRAIYEGGFETQFSDCLTDRIASLDKDIEIMCSYHYQVGILQIIRVVYCRVQSVEQDLLQCTVVNCRMCTLVYSSVLQSVYSLHVLHPIRETAM